MAISTPLGLWSIFRSYDSTATGGTALGNKWLNGSADQYLIEDGADIKLHINATHLVEFTASGSPPTYTAAHGQTLELTHDATNDEFIVTDTNANSRTTYHDFTITNTAHRGRIKEESTRQWHTQGKAGYEYSFQTDGRLSQVTTPEGQDFNIIYTYSGTSITKIELKNASNVLIGQVDYTYYGDVTTPSTDLGSSGDLVQVKVSRRATADAAGTLSHVRYMQYRYDSSSNLKAVYEHDAIQRIINELGVTDETDLLTKDDDYGDPDVELFANRRFTYYTADTSTSSIDTPFTTAENLNSTYGGSEAAEDGMVQSEIIRTGCGSCGSSGGITKTYFYLELDQGATIDQNEVTRLVIEDTEDSDGNAHSRMVYGLNSTGRLLREAFIDDPTGTPAYWCESWKMATTGKLHRVSEYRQVSAHDVGTASELRDFLDPYDSEGDSWTNDTNTLHASDGVIHVHTFNSAGVPTDAKVKQGRTGTEYYTWAADYGDGDGDSTGDDHANNVLMVASYYYPTQTTTRADGKKTEYSYTFWDTADREVKTKTTTYPTVSTSQNGSGVATETVEYYDDEGRLRWTKDGDGYVNYYAPHPETGSTALMVTDVDPSSPGTDVTSGSSGEWEAWTTGSASTNKPTRGSLPTALGLAHKTFFNDSGYPSHTEDPGGAEHYIVYENTRTIRFPYWDSTNSKSLLPIQVSELADDENQVGDRYSVRASYTAISVTSSEPTGFSTEPGQSDYVSWTRYTYHDTTGSLSMLDRYHDIPSSGTGTLSTNFYRTVQQTDAMGRNDFTIQVVSGSTASDRKEQVTQQEYDIRGRVIRIKQGVSGDSAANSHNMTDDYDAFPTMTTIAEMVYDENGIGDGHVTQTRRYHGTGTNDYTGVNMYLTYRGHVRGQEPFYMNGSTETAGTPVAVMDVNWQGQNTASGQFIASPTWTTVLTGDGYTDYATSTTTNRRTLTETVYDELGRTYRSDTYAINVTTGAKWNLLRTDTFYDRRGNIVAQGDLTGGTATEMAYDGAGRQYQSRTVLELESTRYSSGAFAYRAPEPHPAMSSMSGGDDKVITLSHSVLDDDGNVTEHHAFDMNHDDGTLGIDLTADDDYVRRSVYSWYDDADRLVTMGDYGSGDTATGAGQWEYAAVPTRPGTAPTTSSDTVLVTAYDYDSATGRQSVVTDPAGIDTKTFYNDMGQATWVAENYDNFDPGTLTTISDGTDTSKDRVTQTEYDGAGNTIQLTAYNGSSTATQETVYLFEDSVAVNRNTNTIYPDSSDTTSGGSDQVKVTYNIDGSMATRTDQRGTVIAFAYDDLRRPQSQKVTTLGGSTDGTIRSITKGYDTLGRIAKITSHGNQTDDPDNTTDVENQVVYTYSVLGKVAKSEQSHSGVVGGSTPSVEYTYSNSNSSGVLNSGNRPVDVTYPNGRVVYSHHGTADGLDDRTHQPKWLLDTNSVGTQLIQYSRTGSGRTVITDYPQPDIKLDLFQGTSGTYAGLDRFGRTIDQFWDGYGSTADVDRVAYTYDEASNRTSRDILTAIYAADDLDQTFAYDGLHRLTTFEEGTLTGGSIVGTPDAEEDWTLDQLNNWDDYLVKTTGTTDLDQSRTHNDVNEITDITETTGPAWATPAHDAAGNMTTIPQPADPALSFTATYDAWNRMTKLEDATNTIAEYAYDGRNYRIAKAVYSSGTLTYTDHFYYNENWQALEVRRETSGTEDPDPREQYVWHPDYIDALAVRYYDADTDGNLAENSDGTHYYTQGANYHVLAITNDTGSVLERYQYDPYGRLSVLDADFTADGDNTSDIDNAYSYTGRRLDEESGLRYFRNRYYDTSLGRFLSRDPINYVDGNNLNTPYFVPSRVDPTGNMIICGAAGGFIGWFGAFSGQVLRCFDNCGNPARFVFCGGGGAGLGGGGAAGVFIGSGCITPGWSGQITGQGSIGPIAVGGSVGTSNSGAGAGVGLGGGAACTGELCYAI